MRRIGIILAVVALAALGALAWQRLGPRAQRTVPIYMFHRVDPHPRDEWTLTPAAFEARLRALHDAGRVSVTPADLVRHLRLGRPIPTNACVITFDDGNLCVLEQADPVLRRYGFRAIVYLVTDTVHEAGEPRGNVEGWPTLKWDEVRAMLASGRFVFGSHAVHHVRLTNDVDRMAELCDSADAIERHTGMRPDSFAFPFGEGANLPGVRRALRAAGYTSSVTVIDKPARLRPLSTDPYRLPRVWARP